MRDQLAVGTNDVLLAPRLARVGLPPGLAGPLLAGFIVASMVGGLGYGARRVNAFRRTRCVHYPLTRHLRTLVLQGLHRSA